MRPPSSPWKGGLFSRGARSIWEGERERKDEDATRKVRSGRRKRSKEVVVPLPPSFLLQSSGAVITPREQGGERGGGGGGGAFYLLFVFWGCVRRQKRGVGSSWHGTVCHRVREGEKYAHICYLFVPREGKLQCGTSQRYLFRHYSFGVLPSTLAKT